MDLSQLAELTLPQFAVVVALFLPGFVSLRVDSLIHPSKRGSAADDLIEIAGYSLLNAAALSPAIWLAAEQLASGQPNLWLLGILSLITCVAGPALWPIAFRRIQRWAAHRGWIIGQHRNAWDEFFSRGSSCWVILHLPNGELVGGYFGRHSSASAGEEAGHIYIEELWQLGPQGQFLAPTAESKGAIFRPDDYLWIEFRKDD